MAKQRKKIKEPWPWSSTWRRLLSESVSQWWPGDALQLPKGDLAGALCVLRAPEASAV